MTHKETAIRVWQFFHMALFTAWLLGTMVTADQPAWFLSGSLGFSFVCMTIVVLVIPLTRDTALSQLDEVKRKVAVMGRYDEIVKMLDDARPPLIARKVAWGLLAVAILGLAPMAWYFANTFKARTSTYASTYTQQLAHELWHNDPGSTIAMLTLLSFTALMHLVDIVVAAVVIARGCRTSVSASL